MHRFAFLAVFLFCLIPVQLHANELGEAIMGMIKPLQDEFKKDVLQGLNTHMKAENYNYQGIDVRFTHRQWKIDQSSICDNYKADSMRITQCSRAALYLFKLGCEQFKSKTNKSYLDEAEMRMYCQAALSYKPMVVTVGDGVKKKVSARSGGV